MHVSFLFGLHPGYASSVGLPRLELEPGDAVLLHIPLSFSGNGARRFPTCWPDCRRVFHAARQRNCVANLLPGTVTPVLFSIPVLHKAGILIFRALRAEEDEVERIALAAVAVLLVSGAPGYYGSQVVAATARSRYAGTRVDGDARHHAPCNLTCGALTRGTLASDTSYSVYLFHLMFVSIGGLILQSHRELFLPWRSSARAGLLLLFVAACSYPLGYVIHRFVELPGIELGKRLLSRKTMSPRKAASVSV